MNRFDSSKFDGPDTSVVTSGKSTKPKAKFAKKEKAKPKGFKQKGTPKTAY